MPIDRHLAKSLRGLLHILWLLVSMVCVVTCMCVKQHLFIFQTRGLCLHGCARSYLSQTTFVFRINIAGKPSVKLSIGTVEGLPVIKPDERCRPSRLKPCSIKTYTPSATLQSPAREEDRTRRKDSLAFHVKNKSLINQSSHMKTLLVIVAA